MSRKVKTVISFIMVILYYSFDSIIYPKLMSDFAMAQADNAAKAFVGLQTLSWAYTWVFPIICIILIMIWFKELKGLYISIKNRGIE